jgi:hypothetical protein
VQGASLTAADLKLIEKLLRDAMPAAHASSHRQVATNYAAAQRSSSTPSIAEVIRHISGDTVRTARTAAYSSVVNNNQSYSYDHRTQFTGPVTVKADDPMKIASELKKAVAHARLVAPGRAAQPTSW